MNTNCTQDNATTETTDFAAIDLRLLADFEITQVGGGEAVASFF